MSSSSLTTPENLAGEVEQILRLRIAGHSYSYIAAAVARTPEFVRRILINEARRVLDHREELVDELVVKQLAECEFLLKRLMKPYTDLPDLRIDPKDAMAIAKVQERISKLLGLDQPSRHTMSYSFEHRSDDELRTIAVANGIPCDI